MMEKYDKVFDIEIITYVRVAYNDELAKYVQSDDFTDSFYDLFPYGEDDPEAFLKFLSLMAMSYEKLSETEGFSKDHDKMYKILGEVKSEIYDTVDMSEKIDWSR